MPSGIMPSGIAGNGLVWLIVAAGLVVWAGWVGLRKMARDRGRRDAERARMQSVLAATFEATTDGIVVVDKRRRLTHWNHNFVRMWRVEDEAILRGDVTYSLTKVAHQLKNPEGFLAQARFIEANPEAEYLDVLEFVDGRVFERATRPLIVGGAVVGRVASFHDITDAVRTTQALRQSESEFKAAFDDAPVGIALVHHRERRPFRVNRAMCELLGYSAAELVALSFDEITYASDVGLGERITNFLETDAGGAPILLEKRYVRKDGAIVWALVSAVGVRDASGVVMHALTVFQDITARKEAEQALAIQEDELRHAQKMEAVGRLAAGMAHDFNNLLTIIGGNSQLLLEGAEPRGSALREISAATQRAAALTRQLLAFSRGQPLAPKLLDLGLLVADMEGLLRRLVGPAVAVEIDIGRGPWWVLADPVQMGQVVLNVVINARDAIGGKGEITVDVSPMTVTTDQPVGDAPPGSYVVLRVRDTGCGMTDEVRRRIFEPFYTTKPVGEGTGLGLATVYGIVHQSGGAIVVDSRPGAGTTFTVVLPAKAAPTEPTADAGGSGGGGRTVLVVDDEHGVRALARHALESHGYRVLTASDGEEGIRSAETSVVPIDCVITDLLMPTMNGVEMVQQLRRARPELPVLYISGYFDGASPLEATLPQATAVLSKPFTALELARAVDGLVRGAEALLLRPYG